MLELFLSEGELLKGKSKAASHLSCDLCADRCDCGPCDLTPIEKRLMVNSVEFNDHCLSDTESIKRFSIDSNHMSLRYFV